MVPVPDGPIRLAVTVNGASQQFHWAAQDAAFMPLGDPLDASLISDEGGRGEHASFTGAFVGMIAYDLTGQGWSAEVSRFSYSPG
jgi:xylan 1,4-beta-xylosidase